MAARRRHISTEWSETVDSSHASKRRLNRWLWFLAAYLAVALLLARLVPRASHQRRRNPQPREHRSAVQSASMAAADVDEYLRELEEPKRGTLQLLRATVLEIVPEAEQVISYRALAFRVQGTTIAGFAAFQNHLSYLPFSGSVLPQLASELADYTMTKSALHFGVDKPLPKALVKKLIAVRLAESRRGSREVSESDTAVEQISSSDAAAPTS